MDVKLKERLARPLELKFLRGVPELDGMELLRKGNRLSVQPVRPAEFETIMRLAREAAES